MQQTVGRQHQEYLRELEKRAQKLLDLASSMSEDSSEDSRKYPDDNKATQSARHVATKLRNSQETIRELEYKLQCSEKQRHVLQKQIRKLRENALSSSSRKDVNMVAEELQRFKMEERKRLKEKFEDEIEEWARRVQQAQHRADRKLKELKDKIRQKDMELQQAIRKQRKYKDRLRRLISNLTESVPSITQDLWRGIQLVDQEILRLTNPQL